jgi:thioredoxin-dependent peroxiredoxin
MSATTSHITFQGDPLELAGEPPHAGQQAPDFRMHRLAPDDGLVPVTLADLPRKPRLISVVPSLDTPVCSEQTKAFNQALAGFGERVAAYTISLDLPFAQNRYCGTEGVNAMKTLSDYQERSFGQNWGMLINDLKLLARGVFVVDADDRIIHAELVPEITDYPDYDAALAALRDAVDGHGTGSTSGSDSTSSAAASPATSR